jgi:starch-binding outer membrane protein, SusD/RagB family
MKTTKFIALAFIACLLNACGESFLDTEPITTKTESNYYTTPEEAAEALVGCYDALQLIWSGSGIAMPVASDVMSDLCFGGTGAADGDSYPMIDQFDKTVSPADLNLFEGNWTNYYTGIYRCNVLISKMDQVNWTGQEYLRGQIEAEARFLRAFFYFDMVRMFERVPLLTVPSVENIPQSEPDLTYEVITEDLLYAIENGSDVPFEEIAEADYGHANKWSAEALMARVFLYYTGYYGKTDLVGLVTGADALAYLEDVISAGGFGLVEDYSDLWPAASTYAAAKAGKPIAENTYAGETHKEVVFAIKYTYTSDYNGNTDGNGWLVMNGLRGTNWPKSGYGSGWGACTVLPSVYSGWDANDKRRAASIMAITEEGITFDNADQKEHTGYMTKKYVPTCDKNGASTAVNLGGVNFMIGQFQDYFSIRYADVLLMAAELGSVNALDYVNLVRARAGVTELGAVDKDIIYEERRLEFAFEGIRYWDLLRYDHTLAYAAGKVAFSGTVKNGGTEVPKIIDGNNLIATRGLFQIPNNQITLSDGVLEQNPGW